MGLKKENIVNNYAPSDVKSRPAGSTKQSFKQTT